MWGRTILCLLFIAISISSCDESNVNGPDSTGRGFEIIVVCDKNRWNGPVGDTIRAVLTRQMQGTPEAEPQYTLINIPPKDFSHLLQAQHNVLIIDNMPQYEKSKVETLVNVWAHPQRVVKIQAASDTALIREFGKNSEAIVELFNQNERARFSAQNALNRDYAIEKMLTDTFGIRMVVSRDFKKVKEMKDFVWLRSRTKNNDVGLMIYILPYIDTSQMNTEQILASLDKFTKIYIPGPTKGSFMTTERTIFVPESRKLLFKDMFARETRGLWCTAGDSMSGPFINYAIVDAPRQRIVVFDGYVYCPDKSKRNYIRLLESLIWEAQFCDPKVTK